MYYKWITDDYQQNNVLTDNVQKMNCRQEYNKQITDDIQTMSQRWLAKNELKNIITTNYKWSTNHHIIHI